MIKCNKNNDITLLQWNEDVEQAFEEFKTVLVNITLLAHTDEKCQIVLCTYASFTAIEYGIMRLNLLHSLKKNVQQMK